MNGDSSRSPEISYHVNMRFFFIDKRKTHQLYANED